MKQHLLFDLSDLEKRKPTSQKQFEEQHNELLCAMPGIIKNSFQRLNSEVLSNIELRSRDKNLAATTMIGLIKGELIKRFPNYCTNATKVRFKLKKDDGEWIYVKKLHLNKLGQPMPKNITTRSNEKIYNQRADDGEDKACNVFIGYTALKDMTEETGVYAICFDGQDVKWISDLNSLAKATPTVQLENEKVETALKEGIVMLKKKTG